MNYSSSEVIQYIKEEDVKFIRLAFCDVYGRQKNISVMPGELERAFSYGITIDASAICGFGGEVHSDLLLHPDPSTIAVLPWRPEHGRVIRMFCDITHPDGKPITAVFCAARLKRLKKRAIPSVLALKWNFICLRPMKRVILRIFLMTGRGIWISPRMIKARMCGVKFVLRLSEWELSPKALITRKARDRTR